ncbi:MAG: oligosaccharide flippase family protein [Nanoarchaeota archaeon]
MIKKSFLRIKNDKLVRGSFTLLIAIGIFNLFGFLFHTIMARMLSTADYGVFASLMAIIFILGIPSEAIQTWMSRIVSRNKNNEIVRGILEYAIKKYFKISIIIVGIGALSTIILSEVLQIPSALIIISIAILFALFLIPLTRGIMQGEKDFKNLGLSMIIEATLKLLIALTLVKYLNLGVYGAMLGVIITMILTLYFSFKQIRSVGIRKIALSEVVKSKAETYNKHNSNTNENTPIWIIMSTILIFFSMDILVAKSIFTAEIAGQYAVISIIGKIIFFASNSVSKAMFPMSSEDHNKEKRNLKIIKKSLLMTMIIIILGLGAVALFPQTIVSLLFGNNYVESAGILLATAISFSLLSLTNLFLLHAISTNLTSRYSYILIIFPILQIIILPLATTLKDFSIALLLLNTLLLAAAAIIWIARVLNKYKSDK